MNLFLDCLFIFGMQVNNAGSGNYKKMMETTPEILESILDINVKAPFNLSQRCAPHLIKTQGKIKLTNQYGWLILHVESK